jgi:Flp pilus assembly protein TadG
MTMAALPSLASDLRRPRFARGQAVVETAFILPILIWLVCGVADLGRVIYAHHALQEATQEGALYAAYVPAPDTGVIDRVVGSSQDEWVTGATVSVVCTTAPAPGKVTVTSQYDLPLMTPLISSMFGGDIPLSITIVATNMSGGC